MARIPIGMNRKLECHHRRQPLNHSFILALLKLDINYDFIPIIWFRTRSASLTDACHHRHQRARVFPLYLLFVFHFDFFPISMSNANPFDRAMSSCLWIKSKQIWILICEPPARMPFSRALDNVGEWTAARYWEHLENICWWTTLDMRY